MPAVSIILTGLLDPKRIKIFTQYAGPESLVYHTKAFPSTINICTFIGGFLINKRKQRANLTHTLIEPIQLRNTKTVTDSPKFCRLVNAYANAKENKGPIGHKLWVSLVRAHTVAEY